MIINAILKNNVTIEEINKFQLDLKKMNCCLNYIKINTNQNLINLSFDYKNIDINEIMEKINYLQNSNLFKSITTGG